MARRKTMNVKTKRYVICIKNDDYEVDLSLGKVYRVIPERVSEARGFVRMVDESGEDYLYPRAYFLPIAVPRRFRRLWRKHP
ncbi:MAG: hypothetical protein ACRD6I_07520 [Candidatus Acidiferrales bacterium]